MIYAEYEAKAILSAAGLPVPDGRLIAGLGDRIDAPPGGGPWYVKAQIHEGGRGKRGLVRLAHDAADLREACVAVHREVPDAELLVEVAVAAVAERYVAVGLDTARACPFVMVGADGGVEVEGSDPTRRARLDVAMSRGVLPHDGVTLARRVGLPSVEAAAMGRLLCSLWETFRASEGELLEINPAIWDGQRYILADAKLRTFEREAQDGTVYFDRPGSVAVLSGGAGLGMALADMLHHLGAPPANFADVVGGVTRERLQGVGRQVLFRCRDDEVRALVVVLSVSLTPLAGVLEAIRDLVVEVGLPVPAVAYFGSGAALSETDGLLADLAALGVDVVPDVEAVLVRAAALAGRTR